MKADEARARTEKALADAFSSTKESILCLIHDASADGQKHACISLSRFPDRKKEFRLWLEDMGYRIDFDSQWPDFCNVRW